MRAPGVMRVSKRNAGTVLLLTLIIAMVVSAVIVGAVVTTNILARTSQFDLERVDALALADGVTDQVQKSILQKVANFESFDLSGSITLKSTSIPYTVTAIGSPITRTDPDGINLAIQPYRISATVDVGAASATVNRIVDLTMTPIFQFMIFYSGDLELLPGPNMTLGGRVHANGSIYAGTGSGSTLTVDSDYFRSTGKILRQRKDDNTPTSGTVRIKVYGESSYKNMDPVDDSTNPDWINLALTTWKSTVQSGAHGVKEVAAPQVGSILAFDPDTGAKGYYHKSADLVIKNNLAYDKNGNLVALPAGTITQKVMYDAREAKSITVTEVNIGLLNSSGKFPANGLLYAYRTDTTSILPNGIRLTNGATLKAPLTVATDGPLFIRGDYNTVNRKGAAVIADAVNLLSKSWNDTKVPGTLPRASMTTYNVALVSGDVPTPDGGGNYSGGFENLPRFHENWGGIQAVIRGSFIKIFDSRIAKAPWRYGGDVYTAPNRVWSYDPSLNNLSNLPPFTPNAVYFRRVLWDDGLTTPLSGL